MIPYAPALNSMPSLTPNEFRFSCLRGTNKKGQGQRQLPHIRSILHLDPNLCCCVISGFYGVEDVFQRSEPNGLKVNTGSQCISKFCEINPARWPINALCGCWLGIPRCLQFMCSSGPNWLARLENRSKGNVGLLQRYLLTFCKSRDSWATPR